jgi:flagellar M-ring protein FliF
MVVLAIVALVLGLFVVRPLVARQDMSAPASLPAPKSSNTLQETEALTGEIEDENGNFVAATGVQKTALAPSDPGTQNDAVERLRALISERQDETVEILRNWLEDEEPAR